MKNQTVFVPPHITIEILEERLKAAYGVIKESKDMNINCRGYALPSLCYSILPICRTPEKTNHQYFANKAADEHLAKKAANKHKMNIEKKNNLIRKQPSGSNRRSSSSGANGEEATIQPTFNTATIITSTTPSFIKLPTPIIPMIGDSAASITPTFFFRGGVTPAIQTSAFHMVTKMMSGDQLRKRRSYNIDAETSIATKNQHHFAEGFSDEADVQLKEKVLAFRQTDYPPTKSSENVRRICRNECELLENELCQKEYAIAKRHPTIGQKLPLEDCNNLPDSEDCSKLGIVIDVDENEECYWENGSGYRGTVAVSQSGKKCLQWARLMKEIADYPELAGQNYCR